MALTKADLKAIGDMIAAANARPARSRTKAATARTFATKAERARGDGFPCTADEPCGRTDLRTADSGASHDAKADHWHTPLKAAPAK